MVPANNLSSVLYQPIRRWSLLKLELQTALLEWPKTHYHLEVCSLNTFSQELPALLSKQCTVSVNISSHRFRRRLNAQPSEISDNEGMSYPGLARFPSRDISVTKILPVVNPALLTPHFPRIYENWTLLLLISELYNPHVVVITPDLWFQYRNCFNKIWGQYGRY